MREGVDVPDFTASILVRVDERRAFLSGRDRRRVLVTRAALGVSVASVALGFALAHRYAPESVEIAPQPTHLSSVISCVQCEATSRVSSLRQTLNDASEMATPRLTLLVASVAASSGAAEPSVDPLLSDAMAGSGGRAASSRLTAACFVGPLCPSLHDDLSSDVSTLDRAASADFVVRAPTGLLARGRRGRDELQHPSAVEPPRVVWFSDASARMLAVSGSSGADRRLFSPVLAPLSPGLTDDESMVPK